MTRRQVLNISSIKKRNNIPPVSFNYQGASPVVGARIINSGDPTFFIWRPTALEFSTNSTSEAARTAQKVYWRGIKERCEILTATGVSWRWRRIIFSIKGTINTALVSNVLTSNGYPRAMIDLTGNPPASIRNSLEALMFQGIAPADWTSVFHAKVDNNRVKVHYDKLRHLNSGNEQGKWSTFHQWIPLNSNMTYDDEERGSDESAQSFATLGRQGMGDVYVYDMFECTTTGNTNQMSFNPQATLYWHER